jgi:membrane protein YdbS with pleckstrin-like domain
MLTEDESRFVAYWETHRNSKKKLVKQLAVGLPLSVALVIAIFVNFFSGWYKRAEMIMRTQTSLILVLVIAAISIVIFMSVFSAKHRWDQNEQRYREFLAKKDKP